MDNIIIKPIEFKYSLFNKVLVGEEKISGTITDINLEKRCSMEGENYIIYFMTIYKISIPDGGTHDVPEDIIYGLDENTVEETA